MAGGREDSPARRRWWVVLDIGWGALLVELERDDTVLCGDQVTRAAVPVSHQRLTAFARRVDDLIRAVGVPEHIHTPRTAKAIPVGVGHVRLCAKGHHLLKA